MYKLIHYAPEAQLHFVEDLTGIFVKDLFERIINYKIEELKIEEEFEIPVNLENLKFKK